MPTPVILLVDDEPKNIKLLTAMLAGGDYRILPAVNGEEALEKVRRDRPDLILLDVMMPGIDGFEVCRRLKTDPTTRMLPIVMVTALREKTHRLRALEAGADDFLSKPVDRTELFIRVKSLLRIKKYADELIRTTQDLRQKNRQLRELEKVKEGLTHMIIHDLRSPLTAISGNLDLALFNIDGLNSRLKGYLTDCRHYCDYLNESIQSLLDIYKMEQGRLKIDRQPVEPCRLAVEVRDLFAVQADAKSAVLRLSCNGPLPVVEIDAALIRRVIANLVDNAIRHTPENGTVQITMAIDDDNRHLLLRVTDSGPGLPAKYHCKVFDKFEQVRLRKSNSPAGSAGLGLAFCKMAVELHGGKIWVESAAKNGGCTFALQIPMAGSAVPGDRRPARLA